MRVLSQIHEEPDHTAQAHGKCWAELIPVLDIRPQLVDVLEHQLLAQVLALGREKTVCFLVYRVAVVTFSALKTVVSA